METQPDNAARSKIASLPEKIRQEICRRLFNGGRGPQILPWLNGLAEVQKVLELDYEGLSVSDQNLSVWRKTGYQDWLRRRERIERTRELARYAAQQSKADGATIADGAASIASGKLLELLEAMDDLPLKGKDGEKLPVMDLVSIAGALTSLRVSEQNDVRLAQNDRKLKQKDGELALAREKFQRDTCKLFLKWSSEKKALDVANSDAVFTDKIEALGQLMFPDTWAPEAQQLSEHDRAETK
jgi:hypothetical protein